MNAREAESTNERALDLTIEGAPHVFVGASRETLWSCSGLEGTAAPARFDGESATTVAAAGKLAFAPSGSPLPARWSLTDYLVASARLAGCGKALAEDRADELLEKLDLAGMAHERIERSALAVRRALVVGAAIVASDSWTVFDDPLEGLAFDESIRLGEAIVRALEGRPWVLSCTFLSPTSPLVRAAKTVRFFEQGAATRCVSARELESLARVVLVRPRGEPDAFAAALAAQGLNVSRGAAHALTIDCTSRDDERTIFRIARELNLDVIEFRPLWIRAEAEMTSAAARPATETTPGGAAIL